MSALPQQQVFMHYDPVHLLGEVTQLSTEGVRVHCDGKDWHCHIAASCLLQVNVGDTVLISGPDTERVYIIAVITQADATQACIRTSGALAIHSQSLSLEAEQGHWKVEHLHYQGKKLHASLQTIKVLSRILENVVDRLRTMARCSVKVTKESEQLHVGTYSLKAEHKARLHSQFTSVTASELVKVDAKQIHMG
ncbi:DUF3540 domain-containing protein [Alcaligenes endophyticus]|uniref:DUF3540 domain-containing protein n=1 Tax=Alcaligenes endophyticus TaxID=1929088 RepID=A0ABT8EKN2_9BURK|nr:DUF3540 domain-containing protein [Alcaligenes endophyticus]MCX5590773.1 DUF3540 domain-containing protein [Alcaligenes endophyticus]MDN4121864.1 DUF3540 domain-containing protein [Alcaligenes endophyticus]